MGNRNSLPELLRFERMCCKCAVNTTGTEGRKSEGLGASHSGRSSPGMHELYPQGCKKEERERERDEGGRVLLVSRSLNVLVQSTCLADPLIVKQFLPCCSHLFLERVAFGLKQTVTNRTAPFFPITSFRSILGSLE